MANGKKMLTITTVTQENHRFYDVWQQAESICPICTNHDDISWADLQSDLVELCDEHKKRLHIFTQNTPQLTFALADALENGKLLTFDDQKHGMAQRILRAGLAVTPDGELPLSGEL